MNYYISFAMGLTIGIAAVISLSRFQKIGSNYYPFLLVVWGSLMNEVIGHFSAKYFHSNVVCSNIYTLIESLLIFWQFFRWKLFPSKKIFVLAEGLLLTGWTLDALFLSRFADFNSYFRLFYGFPVVLMSIHLINAIIVRERRSLFQNPIFLICSSFVIYFTYNILVEMFWAYGLYTSGAFQLEVYRIMTWINLFCNLIYALATLWMRKREAFTMQF